MEDVKDFYSTLESSGIPKRYTHNLFNYQVGFVLGKILPPLLVFVPILLSSS